MNVIHYTSIALALVAVFAAGMSFWHARKAKQAAAESRRLRQLAEERVEQQREERQQLRDRTLVQESIKTPDKYRAGRPPNVNPPAPAVRPSVPRAPRAYGDNPPPAPRQAGMSQAHAAPYASSPAPAPTDYHSHWVHAPSPAPSYSSDCSSSDSSSSSSSDSSSSCSSGD